MALFKLRFVNSANSFVGRAINWVTNSIMDHAEIETDEGNWIGAHAGSGVEERPADYMQPTWERRYSIPCTDEQYAKMMAFAKSKIGTQYDYTDILGLLMHNRGFHNPNKLICSVFVLEVAQAGGIQMLNVLPTFDYLITPETLHLSPLLYGRCTYAFGN